MDLDVTAIIIAILAIIPGVYAALSQFKKDRVDAGRLALEIADNLDAKVKELEKTVKDLQAQLKIKDARIAELERLLHDRNGRVEELEREVADLYDRLTVVEKRRVRPERS